MEARGESGVWVTQHTVAMSLCMHAGGGGEGGDWGQGVCLLVQLSWVGGWVGCVAGVAANTGAGLVRLLP